MIAITISVVLLIYPHQGSYSFRDPGRSWYWLLWVGGSENLIGVFEVIPMSSVGSNSLAAIPTLHPHGPSRSQEWGLGHLVQLGEYVDRTNSRRNRHRSGIGRRRLRGSVGVFNSRSSHTCPHFYRHNAQAGLQSQTCERNGRKRGHTGCDDSAEISCWSSTPSPLKPASERRSSP